MKKSIITTLIAVIFLTANAQIYKSSTQQQFVEGAVKPGLFVAMRSFQLWDEKTDELFGYNNNKEFGTQYALGVKITDGYCVPGNIMNPWDYDSNFKKYSKKYSPLAMDAKYTELNDSAALYRDLDMPMAHVSSLHDKMLYEVVSSEFDGEGFSVDKTFGEKKGWIVWVFTDQETDLSKSLDVRLAIYKKTINLEDGGSNIFEIEPQTVQKSIGGIFVVPEYTGVGKIEFRLCGVIVPNGEKWNILCPFAAVEPVKVSEKIYDESDDEKASYEDKDAKDEKGDVSDEKGLSPQGKKE